MKGTTFWVGGQVEGCIGHGTSTMGVDVDSGATGPKLWVEG